MFVGNNEDGTNFNAKAWFVPSNGESYGYVAFGFEDGYAQGGMNDQGFFMDWATTEIQSIPYSKGQRYLRLNVFGYDFNEMILRKSATVEDAIALYRKFFLPEVNGHALLADRSGRSVIVEWYKGKLQVLPADNTVQFMTNINLWEYSVSDRNWIIDPRYNRLQAFFSNRNNQEASQEQITAALESTYQIGSYSTGTIYSNIYNLTTGDVTTIYMRDRNNSITWNLHEQLAKNKIQLFDLKDMFAANSSYPNLQDRNSQNVFGGAFAHLLYWVIGTLLGILATLAALYFFRRESRTKWVTALLVTTAINVFACMIFSHGLLKIGRYIRFQLTTYEKLLYEMPKIIILLTLVQIILLIFLWVQRQSRLLDRVIYSIHCTLLIIISLFVGWIFIVGEVIK
ncbi:linear amide C-N hydrolase [Cohnella caldifontis]|uniref:linear amide C-N hydrolase n=1 Tax=Cohnella caldifontis TaxID=3027471 RepID=UPI0023ED9E84|nr:linear amide C-N hydrolase [Cohnella sp. YIM B05605]